MIRRLVPHPFLSIALAVVWMMLVNRFAWGSLIFAIMAGLTVPALTAAFWPDRPEYIRPGKALAYLFVVLWDIIVANIQIGRMVVFVPNSKFQPAWISVPLDVTRPEAVTALAATITLTPGTVSCDLSERGDALLVHCLHAPDPQSIVDEIKSRYEARLKEIFP